MKTSIKNLEYFKKHGVCFPFMFIYAWAATFSIFELIKHLVLRVPCQYLKNFGVIIANAPWSHWILVKE
jgi:hypothetical protein